MMKKMIMLLLTVLLCLELFVACGSKPGPWGSVSQEQTAQPADNTEKEFEIDTTNAETEVSENETEATEPTETVTQPTINVTESMTEATEPQTETTTKTDEEYLTEGVGEELDSDSDDDATEFG